MHPALAENNEASEVKQAIQKCFNGEGCSQCGACCNYLTGQFVPTKITAILLKGTHGQKLDDQHEMAGFDRFKRFGCPYLGWSQDVGGKKTCVIHDIKQHPSVIEHGSMLRMCREWSGKGTQFQIKKHSGKSSAITTTSEQDELLDGIAEHIILPPSVERFRSLIQDFDNGVFDGVEDRIKTKVDSLGERLIKGGGLLQSPGNVILGDWLISRYLEEGIMPHENLFQKFGIDKIIRERVLYRSMFFWAYYSFQLLRPSNKPWLEYINKLKKN